MDLKPAQFTVTRMLHAMIWFAVAAALFGAVARSEVVLVAGFELRGWLALGGLIATGAGLAVLYGHGVLRDTWGRSMLGAYCGVSTVALQIQSTRIAQFGIRAAAAGEPNVARRLAASSESFSVAALVLLLAACVFTFLAMREGRGYAPLAALIFTGLAVCCQFLLVV
jgi:hypothetical protein